MQALAGYDSSDSENANAPEITLSAVVNAPPMGMPMQTIFPQGIGAVTTTGANAMVGEMWAPELGPQNPFKQQVNKTTGLGNIQNAGIDEFTFDQAFRANGGSQKGRVVISRSSGNGASTNTTNTNTNNTADKRKRGDKKDKHKLSAAQKAELGDELEGPWGSFKNDSYTQEQEKLLEQVQASKDKADEDKKVEKENGKEEKEEKEEKILDLSKAPSDGADDSDGDKAAKKPKADKKEGEGSGEQQKGGVYIHEPAADQEKWDRVHDRRAGNTAPVGFGKGTAIKDATSTFHGQALLDYQGRSWTTPPTGVRNRPIAWEDAEKETNYIPKKCVKKFMGHTKGVQGIEFLPNTGHLLLSGGMDGKCKVWDVGSDRLVKRTFSGHEAGVRSVNFSNDGKHFLSSGFDRVMRQWDVETGQAVGTFSNRQMGYQVKYYPVDNHLFVVTCANQVIYQWDTRSGDVVQEYNHHLGPVNAISFYDEGRKFVSTSDDAKILCWEWDIPVPIKHIADPDLHSVPTITKHPSNDYWAGQSMDNSIIVYQTSGEKMKCMKKKVFKGHNNAGYACQVGFSPNGQFISSGDGFGYIHVWDWKSGRVFKKFQAHNNGPCVGCVWHPTSNSMMATCGWDGIVKLWE